MRQGPIILYGKDRASVEKSINAIQEILKIQVSTLKNVNGNIHWE